MKASDKDIKLAWERIEAFLWKYVGPTSSAGSVNHSTVHQQNQDPIPSTAMQNGSEAAHTHRATNGTFTDGVQGASRTETTSSTTQGAGA